MKKLLFFNRFPIIDTFVSEICKKSTDVTIIRTIPDLRKHGSLSQYSILLINIDDRLTETAYIAELTRLKQNNIKVVVFGDYLGQVHLLRRAGVSVFLKDDPLEEDFIAALT